MFYELQTLELEWCLGQAAPFDKSLILWGMIKVDLVEAPWSLLRAYHNIDPSCLIIHFVRRPRHEALIIEHMRPICRLQASKPINDLS